MTEPIRGWRLLAVWCGLWITGASLIYGVVWLAVKATQVVVGAVT